MFHDWQDGYENDDYVPKDLVMAPVSDLAETLEDTINGKNQEAEEGNKKDTFECETPVDLPPEMPCLALVLYEPKPSDTVVVEKDEAPQTTMVESETTVKTGIKDAVPTTTKTDQEPGSAKLGAKPKTLPKPQVQRSGSGYRVKRKLEGKKIKNNDMKNNPKMNEKEKGNQVKKEREPKNKKVQPKTKVQPKKKVQPKAKALPKKKKESAQIVHKDDIAKKVHSVMWLQYAVKKSNKIISMKCDGASHL